MNGFRRGVQVYLLALAFVGTLAVVWGTNRFVLMNSTMETGWPRMVVVAGGLVAVELLVRHRWLDTVRDGALEPYPWTGRDR